jgi:hypothetical protein
LREGIRAYAERQADIWEAIASGHAKYWLAELESKGIDPEWQERYSEVATSQIPGTGIPPSPDTTIPSTTMMDEECILENLADPSDEKKRMMMTSMLMTMMLMTISSGICSKHIQ